MTSREQLWKAWPDGRIEARGSFSTGGWLCTATSSPNAPRPCSWWRRETDEAHICLTHTFDLLVLKKPTGASHTELQDAWREGDLLPNVDPSDVATWACLLSDLAQAAGAPSDAVGIGWRRMNMGWVLSWEDVKSARGSLTRILDIDTNDSATALISARIYFRQQEATNGQ